MNTKRLIHLHQQIFFMADVTELTENQKTALKALGKDVDATPAKTQAEIDAEKLLVDQKKIADQKKLDEDAEAARLLAEKNIPQEKAELTDEELMELVSKKSGRKLSSWDELKPTQSEEDKKKLEENRDSEKMIFGLKKGLFNKKQLEGFISDSKNKVDLVYSRELAEAKNEDPEWNEEKEKEFQDEFNEKFGLNLDGTSSKNKRGQKQIALIADSILKNEYASIYQLDSEFGKYEIEINSRKTQEQRILAAAPLYKEDAEKIVASFAKIEMDFGGDKVEIPVSKEILQSVTDVMLDSNFSQAQILKGYKKEDLQEFAKQYIIGQNFQALAFEAAKKYREKHEKGVRGIPEGGRLQNTNDSDADLTDKQKEALAHFKGQPATVAN